MTTTLLLGDCLDVMRGMPDKSVDLVFCSPPYEDCRLYGINYKLRGQNWVDWIVPRFEESLRVSRGLVAWVVAGRTRKFQWTATPALLAADLHRRGIKLRNPPIFHRSGIAGSGGPDWLRSDYEWVICASHGKLPWSNNLAMGHPTKYKTGGALSYRTQDGTRINKAKNAKKRYARPEIANPGNVIKCNVGKGHMGSDLAHENEAPFPEKLAEFFVRSFCPPGGTVLDPFSGSGTTVAVAEKWGCNGIGIDCRDSQIELAERRLRDEVRKAA